MGDLLENGIPVLGIRLLLSEVNIESSNGLSLFFLFFLSCLLDKLLGLEICLSLLHNFVSINHVLSSRSKFYSSLNVGVGAVENGSIPLLDQLSSLHYTTSDSLNCFLGYFLSIGVGFLSRLPQCCLLS